MSIYYPSGCVITEAPVCSDCPSKELARVRAIWLQKATYTFKDIEDPTEWATARCAGNVIIFPYTNGTVDQSELLSDGYGNVPQTLDSYEYSLNLHEPNYQNNIPFWNQVKRSNQYLVGYKTQTKICLSAVPAMIFPKAPVSGDIKAKVDINIMIKFIQEDLCVPVNAPPSTFEVCEDC